MKKRLGVIWIVLMFFSRSWSQSPALIIQGESGKLYLEHVVEAGQNWYSIGRMYNTNPKELAPFNGESLEKTLAIGQLLKIPLSSDNFSQNGLKAAGEALIPVYHIIGDREWLYRISTNYNRVPVETLEKWNNINKDQAKSGMPLIVGYLKVRSSQSSLAKESSVRDTNPAPATGQTKKEEVSVLTGSPAKTEPKPASTTVPTSNNIPAANPEYKPTNTYASNHPMGGYFRPDFNAGNGSNSGEAGIFKSTSGWQDGKYYALMNNIQVGTIVKVTNPTTHKSIYAKILGQLPDMKESAGLIIRISNAAASELGGMDQKFPVEIKY
jgi:LysM repeat protein